jgi:hypothetical protein
VSRRFGWWLLATAVIGSQAGHLLVYELRFGGAAMQLQSSGAHQYFPASAKTGLGLAALGLLGLLLLVGAGRVASGRRLRAENAAPFMRTLAAAYTIQLACYVVQETAEAMAGGSGGAGSAPSLMLWGAIGQLPVAIAVTVALRWLGARVGPALEAVRRLAAAIAVGDLACALSEPRRRFVTVRVASRDVLAAGFSRRGPPHSS